MFEDPQDLARFGRYPTPEGVIAYLIQRGIINPTSREADVLRLIAALPPPSLNVVAITCVLSVSRRTLGRIFRRAGLPSAGNWVRLTRALRAHRVILSGGTIRDAALAAGHNDQFTLSNALYRETGFRPSGLRVVAWPRLVDAWIARQRRRGALTLRPVDRSRE